MKLPIVVLLAATLGLPAARGRPDQERCYQEALALQRARAPQFDWPRTPGGEKLALLDGAIASAPECAYLHYLRGVVLDGELGRPEEALEAFERAVDIVPAFDLAHENIALVHRAEALRSFGRPALRPDTAADVFHLTRALAALKRAAGVVAENPLWGPQRLKHLEGMMGEVERELREVKSPEGNADFLDGAMTGLVVTGWRANVRSGFGLGYPVEVTLERGDKLTAASGHRRYGWLKVRLPSGRPGWVYHNLVK